MDDYKIAATKSSCEEGSYVVPSTFPLSIHFGEAVSVLHDWTTGTPNIHDRAPKDGWLFINQPSSSALLFKTIRNRVSPIYVTSTTGTPPPGQHTLTPTGRVMLFFADEEARTSFNVNSTNTSQYEYSYLERPKVTVYFNSSGLWEMVDEHSNDAVANDAQSVISQREAKKPDVEGGEKAKL